MSRSSGLDLDLSRALGLEPRAHRPGRPPGPRGAMADILERKGYYNQLVESFEGIRGKRDVLNEELRQDLATKMAIEDDIGALRDQLLALRKVMAASQRKYETKYEA